MTKQQMKEWQAESIKQALERYEGELMAETSEPAYFGEGWRVIKWA